MGICQEEKKRYNKIDNINTMNKEDDLNSFCQIFMNYQYYQKINQNPNKELNLISENKDKNENELNEIINLLQKLFKKDLPENLTNEKIFKEYKNKKDINYDIDIKANNQNNSSKDNHKQEKNNINKLKENPHYYFTLLFEKLYNSNENDIINILNKGPPNNYRWFIWITIAKSKYSEIQKNLDINNNEIFDEIEKLNGENREIKENIEKEGNNCLIETNLLKDSFWIINYIKLVNCIKYYHKDLLFNNGIQNLIFFPLVISDCDLKNTFYFLRFFFSSNYGLSIFHLFNKNNDFIIGISSITLYILENKNKDLYNYILSLNLKNEEWLDKWIGSFYSDILNISITIRLWDCIIAIGIKFIIYFNIGFIEFYQEKILEFKMKEQFLDFFNNTLRKNYKNKEEILSIREKLIESAFKHKIEDNILKLHIISFIQHFTINQNEIKNNNDNKEEKEEEKNEEAEEEKKIKEKEKIKEKFYNLFNINNQDKKINKEDNYEYKLMKQLKELSDKNKNTNKINEENNLNNFIINKDNRKKQKTVLFNDIKKNSNNKEMKIINEICNKNYKDKDNKIENNKLKNKENKKIKNENFKEDNSEESYFKDEFKFEISKEQKPKNIKYH